MDDPDSKYWLEQVEIAFNEFTGKETHMQKYNEMPKDMDTQLYMVNACNKHVGKRPITKTEAEAMNQPRVVGETEWERRVEGAYAIVTGSAKVEKTGTSSGKRIYISYEDYPEYDYFWFEYAYYGDAAFDLSGKRITTNF